MFRQKKSLDLFERLEQEASDELRLLDELGPMHYDTDYLMELHAEVCEQLHLQQRLQRISLSVGAAGAGWILLGTIAHLLNFYLLAIAACGLATVSFVSFLVLFFFPNRRFQTRDDLDRTRRGIETELRNRRDKQRKFLDLEDW
ncbi:MAG: hypothetical protein RIQ78_838 [Bacteroidota bacterium]|jgi:hypothetical protein